MFNTHEVVYHPRPDDAEEAFEFLIEGDFDPEYQLNTIKSRPDPDAHLGAVR